MWGKGAPRFEGRTITVPEAICYPRPLQEHIPIVDGSGERKTLRLAGVQTAIVGLSDAGGAASVPRFAEVVAAFRAPG